MFGAIIMFFLFISIPSLGVAYLIETGIVSPMTSEMFGYTALAVGIICLIISIILNIRNRKPYRPLKTENVEPYLDVMMKQIESDEFLRTQYDDDVRWLFKESIFDIGHIPLEEDLEGTIFNRYYKGFYQSRLGVSLLEMLSRNPINFTPPFREELIKNYDCLDTKSERLLTKYPWLIGVEI